MARLMLTHVSQNGTITYEHYCDTLTDRSEILDKYITLGSYCFVLHGANGVDVYVADSNKTWCLTPTARPNLQIKNVSTNGTVIADRGYDGLEQVIVNVSTDHQPILQDKIVNENGIVIPDDNYDGLSSVIVKVPFIDVMHTNTDSDSIYASILDGYPQFSAAQAFGIEKKHWWGSNNNSQHWLKITYENPIIINKIIFSNYWTDGTHTWQSSEVIFQGSNDNNTWTDLLTLTQMNLSENQISYDIDNENSYLYYRFLCTSNSSIFTGLGKIKIFGNT